MIWTGEVTEIQFRTKRYRVEAANEAEAREKMKAGETVSEEDMPASDDGVKNRVIHICENSS